MRVKEFYKFFVAHGDRPDDELADMISVKFKIKDKLVIHDLIVTTRHAIDVSENLVERIKA